MMFYPCVVATARIKGNIFADVWDLHPHIKQRFKWQQRPSFTSRIRQHLNACQSTVAGAYGHNRIHRAILWRASGGGDVGWVPCTLLRSTEGSDR